MCENLVRIGWAFQELSFEFSGESETSYLGGHMWPAMPSSEFGKAIWVKSHAWKFGLDWLSLSRVIMSTNIFLGGQKPPLGGLYLTCDAHFPTRMCYSSQKSCVKIWFGLFEIGGMLSLRGRKTPYIRGVTCDLRCPFLNLDELFLSKVMCENLVRIGWGFQELSW